MQRVKMLTVVAFVLCYAGMIATPAPATSPAPGDPAPPLTLEKLLQAPEGTVAALEELKGNVVVLEFWATWCSPCVASIPHLDQLVEKFKNEPVRLISITDEGAEVIEKFLKRRPMRGWIGIDTDRSVFDAYGVTWVPHTVLVGKDGRVAAVTDPLSVTEQTLSDVLAGKPAGLPQRTTAHLDALLESMLPDLRRKLTDKRQGPAPILELRVVPSAQDWCGTNRRPGKFVVTGCTIRDLLADAYGIRANRVLVEASGAEEGRRVASFLEDRFDMVVRAPRTGEDIIRPLLQETLAAAFSLVVRFEKRNVDVYVLTTSAGGASQGLKPAASTGGSGQVSRPGWLSFTNCGLDRLGDYLEAVFGKPVVDETGLSARYDWVLEYEGDKPASLLDALPKQLGLKLTPGKRELEFLIAESSEGPTEPDRTAHGDASSADHR